MTPAFSHMHPPGKTEVIKLDLVSDRQEECIALEEPGSSPEPVEPGAVDPVSSTIGLCWNASGNLKTLLMSNPENANGTKKLYGACGIAAWLILLLFFTAFIFSAVQAGAWCSTLMITAAALFTAGALLLMLEGFCLAWLARLKTKQEQLLTFFLMMQIYCSATVVFAAGLPLFGLYLATDEPVWLRWLIPGFSGTVLLAGTVNLILGCITGYRRIFKLGKAATAAAVSIFILQWLAVFPAGFIIFEQIQKINI